MAEDTKTISEVDARTMDLWTGKLQSLGKKQGRYLSALLLLSAFLFLVAEDAPQYPSPTTAA